MIICTCGKRFEGEAMFRDALAHWHAERDKEIEVKLAPARRIVHQEWYAKNKDYQRAYAAAHRAELNQRKRECYAAKKRARAGGWTGVRVA